MQMFLGVKNFAKIEEAKICIDGYTLLVGLNNSGKTFLMQLAQGIKKKLVSLIDKDIIDILSENKRHYNIYTLGEHNISRFIGYFNSKLAAEKESIVYEIFGKKMDIEQLYIDIVLDENDYYCIEIMDAETLRYGIEEGRDDKSFSMFRSFVDNESKEDKKVKFCVLSQGKNYGEHILSIRLYITMRLEKYLANAIESILKSENLFLPASRTGLLYLYRDYFAHKADEAVLYEVMDDKMVENKEMNVGLTKPMYEFLRFLQTYTEDEDKKLKYAEELKFFEERVIEGHINMDKQGGLSYNSKDCQTGIPMYLASSMINEVAPIALALSNEKGYGCLIIDEIEASLHPEKQQEMVCLLNRLYNKGTKLIISTHSDTFVSKVNNLYRLSKQLDSKDEPEREAILQRFGLNEKDLISENVLFVYEFVNQPNGRSIVREISPNDNGYPFDLFTSSALELYEESMKVGEIQ